MSSNLPRPSAFGLRKPVYESAPDPSRLETGFQRELGVFLAALNCALDECGVKRDSLAVDVGMSKGQLSKVTHASALSEVIDRLPHPVRVRFLEHYGRAHGIDVREISTEQLTEDFYDSLHRLLLAAQLLLVRRPTPAKAMLPADPEPDDDE